MTASLKSRSGGYVRRQAVGASLGYLNKSTVVRVRSGAEVFHNGPRDLQFGLWPFTAASS